MTEVGVVWCQDACEEGIAASKLSSVLPRLFKTQSSTAIWTMLAVKAGEVVWLPEDSTWRGPRALRVTGMDVDAQGHLSTVCGIEMSEFPSATGFSITLANSDLPV